jgi:hypothetical protein
MLDYTLLRFFHAIQKYNTIRMMDELMRYAICLASGFPSLSKFCT